MSHPNRAVCLRHTQEAGQGGSNPTIPTYTQCTREASPSQEKGRSNQRP